MDFLYKKKINLLKSINKNVVRYLMSVYLEDIGEGFLENVQRNSKKYSDHLRYKVIEKLYGSKALVGDNKYIKSSTLNEINNVVSENSEKRVLDFISKNETFITYLKNLLIYKDRSQSNRFSILRLYLMNLKFDLKEEIEYLRLKKKDFAIISFSKKDIGEIISIFTPLFLVGGIFKQFLLGLSFSYKPELILNITDYISSSISTIIWAIIPIAFVVFSSLFDLVEYEFNYDCNEKREFLNDAKATNISVLLIFALLFLIDHYQSWGLLSGVLLPFTGPIMIILFLGTFFKWLFKNNFALVTTILSISYFFGIYAHTNLNVQRIKAGKSPIEYVIEVDKKIINTDKINLITSGSNYMAFWDLENNKSILVKKDLVKLIK